MSDIANHNRSIKAAAIVALIDGGAGPTGFDPYADAEGIARWLRKELGDAGWHRLAQAAGYPSKKVPRETTRILVIEAFESRAIAASHMEAS